MGWKEVVAFLEGKYEEYIPDSGKKPQNGYARGFVLPSGLQLAVETTTKGARVNVWVEDCGPSPVASEFQSYKKDKSRTSALSSVAPRLSGPGYTPPPRSAYKIVVNSEQELKALLDWYSGLTIDENRQSIEVSKSTMQNTDNSSLPLNRILYGPPGTGKTYSTTLRAVQICAPDWPSDANSDKVCWRAFKNTQKWAL